jgi:flagellar FliL protein
MAAEAEIGHAAGAAGKMKLPVVTLLIVVILGASVATAAVAGGIFFLMKSGKLALGAAAGQAGPGEASGEPGHPIVLEPILVNLADEGGHAYLRLGLTLDVEGEAAKAEGGADGKGAGDGKTPSEQALAVRDTVLAVLGQQTSAWLLGPDGKEHLKIELKEALAKHNPQLKVKDIYFTDFLVQI